MKSAIRRVGSAISRTAEAVRTEPIFKKTGDRNINNLWTGYEYGAKGKAIVGIGLLGGGSILVPTAPARAAAAERRESVAWQSENQDIESMISTRGDMQGYKAHGGIDPMLQSSGDLVFAMHKTRHGGQF